ncbi:MAG: alpha-E domain-containing protein, partial [Polynucleobacter victoriensis]
LEISELTAAFDASYVLMSPRDVIHFMVSDMNNPSSIMRCLQAARENARAVRGSMTTELWETINTTWLEAQKKMRDGMLDSAPSEFFEWVKFRSHLARGVNVGTMLMDEA